MKVDMKGLIIAFFGLVVCALSITTIVIIAQELYPDGYVSVYYPLTGTTEEYYVGACLMTTNSINVCRYGYSVGAIGALASIVLLFAPCAPPVVSILMSIFNTIWFLAWGITSTVYDHNIDDDSSLPQVVRNYNDKYRTDVYALAWTCFALSFVSMLLALTMKKSEGKDEMVAEKPLPGTQPPPSQAAQPAGYPTV